MTAATPGAPRRDRTGAAIVIVLAIIAGVIAAVAGSPQPTASAGAGPSSPALTPEDFASRTVLVIHRNAAQSTDLIALYSFESADEGDVLLVPPSTVADVPALEQQALADVVRLSSADMLEVTVENLLGVGIDEVVVLDDERMPNAFAPSARVDVDLSHPVEIDDDAGSVSLPEGEQSLESGMAVRALQANEPNGEVAHQATIQSVLEGWRATLGDQRVADAVLLAVPALSTFVAHAGSDLRYEILPVDPTDVDGVTRYAPRRDEIARLVGDRFSWAALNGGDPRPRVAIDDGVGTSGLVAAAAHLVVPAGGEVVRTDSVPGLGVATSQVGYQDDGDRAAAESVAAALGIATVALVTEPSEDVDVTVVLGADFIPPP
jgi:LytR cell envelope-related transcriptional attenuator